MNELNIMKDINLNDFVSDWLTRLFIVCTTWRCQQMFLCYDIIRYVEKKDYQCLKCSLHGMPISNFQLQIKVLFFTKCTLTPFTIKCSIIDNFLGCTAIDITQRFCNPSVINQVGNSSSYLTLIRWLSPQKADSFKIYVI